MKAAQFTALRQVEIVDVPEPKLQKPDDVLLRIDRVGGCGSDVHYYVHGRVGNQRLLYPASVGHECCGTVLEVGPAVERLKPGDRVAIDPAIVCGTCDQCRAGRVNTCRKIAFMGCPNQALGALAEYSVMPADNCLSIPDALSLDQAALLEPLSVGLYAVRLGDVYPAARVAVLGTGPIGLSVVVCAKAVAPCSVHATDLWPERREAARQCGADWTGDPACINQAQELLTPGGILVLVGIPQQNEVCFDVHRMRTKELMFQNVRRQKGCMAPAMRLVAEHQINTRPFLTHRFALDEVREAFELVAGCRDGVVKALIDVSQAPY